MDAQLALPVSVEQVALVVKQMNKVDRQRLLNLVPELRQLAISSSSAQENQQATVERVRREVSSLLGGRILSLGEPFIGELTLGQYLDLPDEERSQLWDAWDETDLEELEEVDVLQTVGAAFA
ncbi:MAG: hypothetical protein ACKO4U_19865 [Caldilinea sp.]